MQHPQCCQQQQRHHRQQHHSSSSSRAAATRCRQRNHHAARPPHGYDAATSSPRRVAAAAADAAPTSSAAADRDSALLLAYYASQNKSLFAAQCFVETVLDAYTCGANVDALQTSLQLKNMQQGGALLQPQDENLLLSWIILVMLAAKEVGVAAAAVQPTAQQQQAGGPDAADGDGGSSSNAVDGISSAAFSREVMGLLQFAKQAAKLWFEEGYNVQKLRSLQATVASDPGQGQSQFLQMMQQYTQLVIITLEVAATCRLPTARPLDNPTSLAAPSGYTAAWGQALPPYSSLQQQQQPEAGVSSSSSSSSGGVVGLVTAAAVAEGKGGLRAHAVKLMTAFVGAAIGARYSLKAFVLAALEAYEAGVPASALHAQLLEQEFAQAGGLVPALPQPEVLIDVNRTLFGRWLSLVYMAAAQQNAVFPGAAQQSGWAWYGGEDEVQANAMAGFVAQTLLRLQEEAAAASQQEQDPDTAQVAVDPLVQRLKSTPEAAERMDAASRELQQEMREQGTLRGKPVPLLVKVPDPDLESTSGAVRVWRQQVEVVMAVYQYMQALQNVAG